MSIIGNITGWFREARPTVTAVSTSVQMGVHFEEVWEMIIEVEARDSETALALEKAKLAMKELATRVKTTPGSVYVPEENKKNYLDALCDQVVTATGCAYDQDFNFYDAVNEVNDSNWSKFVNGKPIFDDNGKIVKGPDYFKPDLTPYI